jgi:hypothetical protein
LPSVRFLRHAVVRRERLAKFGLSPSDRLPMADLRIRVACERADCAPFAAGVTQCLKGYRTDRDNSLVAFFKNTAAVSDLALFSDMAAYLRAVSKRTNGKYHRSANKARRGGYFSRQIAPGSFAQSLFDIKASKATRSLGAVPEATGVLGRPARDDELPPVARPCHEHWRVDWGLFNHANATMWGFASLIRSGNLVHLDHMMVHADVLAAGGMKLMQFDIMAWLLERSDPDVRDLDYLLHGAIEDGSKGAADWRLYVQQRPHALRIARPEPVRLPRDFDPEAYLALNPDVRAAGAEPRQHYLAHGVVEGRAYKLEA